MYTASSAFLEALTEAGVSHIFANFGSDHPALIEAIAEARANGRPIPEIVTCPNEMVGMSAAQGFAQVSGQAQAVLVHVECGTQALAGAVHNAARGRIPMLVFAGASPFTQHGEMKGSRNEFIQWIQDVHDQRGIVRGYMKYDNELRTGRNIKQMVHRAMQFSTSEPRGPVYLMGAREVMEEVLDGPEATDASRFAPIAGAALPPGAAETLAEALGKAERPLIVTSYVGRNPGAVAPLVRLAESLGIGVLESVPNAMNFPHDHALYQGNQWNEPKQNAALAAADCILVVDSDVPWIPTISRPSGEARIFHIDVDPLKDNMPLWDIGAEAGWRADAETALKQVAAAAESSGIDAGAAERRTRHYRDMAEKRRADLAALEKGDGPVTAEYVSACVRRHVDEQTIVLNESITNYHVVFNHMAMTRPGSIFTSGGGSLGWNGGAAIGAKLAEPDKTVVAMTGDGSYMFSVPSSVHWMAAKYKTPFLQVVFNNRGWKAPRFSALSVHPDGYASRANDLDLSFDPPPDYGAIATAAGGAFSRKVERTEEVEEAVAEAFDMVRHKKRAAVLDIWLPQG